MESKKSMWPRVIVAFFIVVFSMNGFFIYKAISSFDGLVEEDYYQKGLNYNDTIQQAKRLGWNIELSFNDGLKTSSSNKAEVTIVDAEGKPVGDADVRIAVRRPATGKFDHTFKLRQAGNAYHGNILIPLAGLWDLTITAEKGTDRMEKVLRVRTNELTSSGSDA